MGDIQKNLTKKVAMQEAELGAPLYLTEAWTPGHRTFPWNFGAITCENLRKLERGCLKACQNLWSQRSQAHRTICCQRLSLLLFLKNCATNDPQMAFKYHPSIFRISSTFLQNTLQTFPKYSSDVLKYLGTILYTFGIL